MIHNYSSHEATESGQCSNAECPEILVTSDLPSSAQVTLPAFVKLSANHPEAEIRYTLDGKPPVLASLKYTAPIQIRSSNLGIRARAFIPGCTPGPILNVAFSNPQFPFVSSYACDTPDKGGAWDEWAPNGRNDHHWVLQFILTGATTIKRLEIYELDENGEWTTGKVWSTDSPINPFPDDPDTDFASFPLLLFIAAAQQHVSYQSSLGSFGAGTHTLDLYGDIETATGTGHLFRLDIILDNDTKLSHIIGNTCTVTPAICPPPATPTLTPKCDGKVDVTFTGTVGRPYRIFRADFSDEGTFVWEQVDEGTIDVSPKTVESTGMVEQGIYSFYVSIDEAGCGYKDSAIVTTVTKASPTVTISTDKTEVFPNESFTISWGSTHIGGAVCGGCLDGQVSINQSIGCQAGNGSGSSARTQATPGEYVYQITACNTCGTVVASVTVEVLAPATCGVEQPLNIRIKDWKTGEYTDQLTPYVGAVVCDITQYGGEGNLPAWNGSVPKFTGRACAWEFNGLGSGTSVLFATSADEGTTELEGFIPFPVVVEFNAFTSRWVLSISAARDEPNGYSARLVWQGEKLYGDTPLGPYTKTAGCATNPSGLIIELDDLS